MPGLVTGIKTAAGQEVEKGTPLLIHGSHEDGKCHCGSTPGDHQGDKSCCRAGCGERSCGIGIRIGLSHPLENKWFSIPKRGYRVAPRCG